MRKLRIIGATITAVAAISAIAVSMASAAAPEFKPASGTFSIKSGKGTLEVAGTPNTVCEKDSGSGEVTGSKTVTLTVDFEKCTILSFIEAHSLGDPANTILLHVTGTLCFINASKKEVGVLLTPTGPVHIEAPSTSTLVVVSGSVIGQVAPVEKSQTTGTVTLPKTALTCEGELDHLIATENEATTTKVAGEVTTEELTFGKATEVTA